MLALAPRPKESVNWTRAIGLLGVLLLLLALTPLSQPGAAAPRADTSVLQLAAQHPDQTISVIIQKQPQPADIETLVGQLGGRVTMDLHIINAIAATLPARAAAQLAQATGVRWVSLDAPLVQPTGCFTCVSSKNLKNSYIRTIGADQVWKDGPRYLQGQGVGVAVVDSGITPQVDFYSPIGAARVVAAVAFNDDANRTIFDGYGHGTHVAGIIGGDGELSGGAYIGVAPMANLINVKVSNDNGGATAANLVKGLQWINDNRSTYNIRVVNISLNSSVAESYHTSPIDAAIEILWFNKIVVVASAGNTGSGNLYPPANDPFVITVGATDDRGTDQLTDDTMASFSAYGKTTDGFSKPDLVAPGTNIISLLPTWSNSAMVVAHPDHIVNQFYFRMSGTSMAAPMVSGGVALLLQDEPGLTPDQVKYRLMATARPFDNRLHAGAGYLDVYAAIHGSTTQSANTNIRASKLLWTGSDAVNWNSVNWNSVNWNSVNWNSVNWNSVNWNSVNWNSDYWGN